MDEVKSGSVNPFDMAVQANLLAQRLPRLIQERSKAREDFGSYKEQIDQAREAFEGPGKWAMAPDERENYLSLEENLKQIIQDLEEEEDIANRVIGFATINLPSELAECEFISVRAWHRSDFTDWGKLAIEWRLLANLILGRHASVSDSERHHSVESEAKRESSRGHASDPKTQPPTNDGPVGTDTFRIGGILMTGVSRVQMRFLEAMLQAQGKAVETKDLIGPGNVWEDEHTADINAVAGMRKRINALFKEFRVKRAIATADSCQKVELKSVSALKTKASTKKTSRQKNARKKPSKRPRHARGM